MCATNVAYTYFWGKSNREGDEWHPVAYHCLDVAGVLRVYLERNPRVLERFASCLPCEHGLVLDWLTFVAALHDVGKFAIAFQSLCPDLMSRLLPGVHADRIEGRHDLFGLLLFEEHALPLLKGRLFSEGTRQKREYGQKDFLQEWLAVAAGHHGYPVSTTERKVTYRRAFKGGLRLAHAAACAYVGDVCDLFLPSEPFFGLPERKHRDRSHIASWEFAGLLTLADWIGSDNAVFSYRGGETLSLADYWRDIALPTARHALREAGVAPVPSARYDEPADLFPEIKGSLTPLQQFVADVPPEFSSASQRGSWSRTQARR